MRYTMRALAALALLAAPLGAAKAEILDFDPTGRSYEQVAVPAGQVLEFTKFDAEGDPTAAGTASIHDLTDLDSYTVPEGAETCRTEVLDTDNIRLIGLAFMARSTAGIYDVFVEATAIDPEETRCLVE